MEPRPDGLLIHVTDDSNTKACKLLLGYINENSRDIKRLEDKLDRVDKLATFLLEFAESMFNTKKLGEQNESKKM